MTSSTNATITAARALHHTPLARACSAALLMLTAAGCARSRPIAPPPRRAEPEPAWPSAPARTDTFYSAEEALRDVLSGELEYIGTGRWPGVERARACAFRNGRVLIVNAYCTPQETQAFRVEVYSPERGRVRIYAETHGVVSARQRADYFTFTVESSPPPDAAAQLPALTLTMPYDALRSYEQQRYNAYLPGCYGGEQNERPISGCLGALAPRQDEWLALNQAFLARPNDDWYQLIRQMRTLATRYGTQPDE